MNTKIIQQLITEALKLPTNAISYHISQQLAAMYPDKGLLKVSKDSFNLQQYAQQYAYAKLCNLQDDSHIYNEILTCWDGIENRVYNYAQNAIYKVKWQAEELDVLLMSWKEFNCDISYYWILAESKELAKNFFTAVCDWNAKIRNEILVFEYGRWYKDSDLFESIQDANFENLVLPSNLKEDILKNLKNFFTSGEVYEKYGVPWKRGILFTGSPGNGKTHTVKALINQLQKPCLYVKSFQAPYADIVSIRQVFKQARQSAPCILVLEDIDSLLTNQNRSFFLNELDGFANNQGIAIIATTNHPERLDPAISNRPSRFDRKYHFELPGILERQAYIALWNDHRLRNTEMQLSDDAVNELVKLTEDFSFAYLKELLFSSMRRLIIARPSDTITDTLENIMLSEVAILREQMRG
ncbi:MAG: ATP-binding protein [Nostoc desertorum CM1-VF14]|nr:ATP-binding protein [Nostoc desertorum CM1-VF14]